MGKEKQGIIKNCLVCTKKFYVARYRVESAKFCSLDCQNHKQYARYKFICEGCGKSCEASPSRKNYKKKFCSLICREHKARDEKQKRRKSKSLQIIKRKGVQGRTLRKYIFEFKEMKCEYCGYCEYDFCLDMHHLDHNPSNNNPDNISILCCICHRKLHKGIITVKGDIHAVTKGTFEKDS